LAIESFHQHPLTRDFEPAELDTLRVEVQREEFIGGRRLCTQGESTGGLYLVEVGRLRVSQRNHEGTDDLTITELEGPTVVGEMELLSDRPAVCTVTAVGAGVAHRLSLVAYQALMKRGDPMVQKLVRNIAHVVVSRLVEANRRYMSVVDPTEYHSLGEALTGCWD
jgi:CRP-like cAMP-binding protein